MTLKIISLITSLIMMITGFITGLTENVKKLFEPPVTYFTTEDVRAKYGEEVRSIDNYADYGFADVEEIGRAHV